jgi:hypothetical protein
LGESIVRRRSFVERRQFQSDDRAPVGERRQFADSRDQLSPEVRELADAIDRYKLEHHRRFIDHEELLSVMRTLGYRKQTEGDAAEQALAALANEVRRDQPGECTETALVGNAR